MRTTTALLHSAALAATLVALPALATAQDSTRHNMQGMQGMKHDSGMKMMDMKGMKHDAGGMKMGMDMKEMPASGWKELDAFHTIMMASWHPAQKDDLKAARTMAGELATAAQAWAASKAPAKCDKAEVRGALPIIAASAKAYADFAKKNPADGELKGALKALHGQFEQAAMACMMGEKKGMHDMKDMKP